MFIIFLLIFDYWSGNVAKRRETLKYGTFGCKKFGFRAMSQRILKLCVASLLNILCFPAACYNDLILTVLPCSALRCTSTTLHWSRSQQPASLIWKLQNILRRMHHLNHPFTLIVSFLHWQWRFKFKTSGVHSIAHYTELFGHCYLDFFGDHQYQSVVLTKSRITHCWV